MKIVMPPLLRSIEVPAGYFADDAERHTLDWIVRHDLVPDKGGLDKVDAMRPGGLAACCYPSADRNQTCILANWMSWLFIFDDGNDEGDLGRLPDVAERTLFSMYDVAFSEGGHEGSADPSHDSLAVALRTIRTEVGASMTPGWRRRFSRNIANYLSACVWQAAHRAADQVPHLDTFPHMRRYASAIWPSFDLIEWVVGEAIPASLYLTSTYQSLLTAAADVVCWTNDLLTLDKEMAHGDTHNMVLVVQGADGGNLQGAIDTVIRMADARVRDFLGAETELHGLLERLHCTDDQRVNTARCTAMLRSWMRGHVDWSTRTRRYWQREDIWGTADAVS